MNEVREYFLSTWVSFHISCLSSHLWNHQKTDILSQLCLIHWTASLTLQSPWNPLSSVLSPMSPCIFSYSLFYWIEKRLMPNYLVMKRDFHKNIPFGLQGFCGYRRSTITTLINLSLKLLSYVMWIFPWVFTVLVEIEEILSHL